MALKIGLISDTHIPEARPTLWPQIYDAFADVDLIFHAGDIHELYVLDASLEDVRMGMRVQAVWKPKEEWTSSTANIKFFRPIDEPDADYDSYKEHI